MPYPIIAVVLVLIIVLVIVFLVVKKKKPEDQPVSADISGTESLEEMAAASELEASDVEATADEAIEEDKVQAVDVSEEEEEFVELSLEAEEGDDEEFVELSLDMEEKEPVEEEGGLAAATADDQEAADVAPALADSQEGSDIIIDEEAPEELTEKLNYYFGGDEDISSTVEEEEAEAEEEEIVLEEPVAAEETVEVTEEVVEAEVPPRLDSEGFEAKLRDIESVLRQQLEDGRGSDDVESRSVVELKLLTVCEKLASMEDVVNRQDELIENAKSILAELHDESLKNEMPGVEVREAEKQLLLGNYEVVEKILGDGILQLDHMSELVARVYYLCGQLAEERVDYESAFEDYRNALAANDECKECLLAAGRIARILGHLKDSLSWLKKLVLQGIEQNEQSLVLAAGQHEMALLCVPAGEKEKAESLYKRALEIREKLQGKDHPDLGPVLHDYARLYESNGMYEQAEELYVTALAVMEKELGSSHPRLASTLNRLAGLYEELEFSEKSLPLYERALAIKEQVLGADHHDVGTILNSLADLLRRDGRLEEAEPMFKRSLEIAENELGKDHPNLTVVLNNLAELYSEMGREEEAAQYQERAFSLFELPGMNGDFVEMEKDDVVIDDKDTKIAGK